MEHVFSRAATRRARVWRTARAMAVVSTLVLVAAPSATSDDGLPPGAGALYGRVISTGRAEAAPSAQWLRVPQTTLWVDLVGEPGTGDITGSIFPISPAGAPHPYGYFPPITVRTLAFGLIPAEATISLAQLRTDVPDVDGALPDADGSKVEDVPVAWVLKGPLNTPGGHELLGQADMRIASLKLDGVEVAVGPMCHTAKPAAITLHGVGEYTPTRGGQLSGTIATPAFTGCGIKGEDLNPLITSMVSSLGSRIDVAQSQFDIGGKGTPQEIPGPFPLPER